MDLGGFSSLSGGLSSIGSFASSLLGAVRSTMHSPIQKATWGDYRKQEYFDTRAEERALANAQELFNYQNYYGPQLSVKGYKAAGLNPVLAGNFGGGSMPSAPTPSASPAPHDFVNNASALIQAGSVFASLAESMSRVQVNEANAKAIQSRTDIENQLLAGRLALQQADLATKSNLPGYYQAQSDRLRSEIVINQIRRSLIDSQISLNNAREVEIGNRLKLDVDRFNADQLYRDRYLDKMHESYLDNKYFGRLYLGSLGKGLGALGETLGGLFRRGGEVDRHFYNPELP